MTGQLQILMAQINPTVGAIQANAALMRDIIVNHQEQHDLILFPELALTGYPPEDLLLQPSLYKECEAALQTLADSITNCHVVIGHPTLVDGKYYNSASVYYQKKRVALYHKQVLPNYGVFDEARYFSPGKPEACIFTVKEYQVALCICEDAWAPLPIEQIIQQKADVLVSINASPFEKNKYAQREAIYKPYAKQGLTILYVNLVGGQDELVFDGQSFVMDNRGEIVARAPAFETDLHSIRLNQDHIKGSLVPLLSSDALLYKALVMATRDYVEKNGFKGVILGLSGGIDSALTLTIAVDALGHKRVKALLMPSRFSADISLIDAQSQLENLDVASHILSIEPAFEAILQTLSPTQAFKNKPFDTTEENIQARIRGLYLMAYANKEGLLVLTTSNKSESAVGYSTLYGDMAGGFAVIKDVLKTEVYALTRYRNSLSPVVPERVLERAPSAELAANQKDADSLPDYPILDAIICAYLEHNLDIDAITQQGFARDTVRKVLRLIKISEHKRHQAALGPKLSARAFGRDWRFPITSGSTVD